MSVMSKIDVHLCLTMCVTILNICVYIHSATSTRYRARQNEPKTTISCW